VRLAVLAVVLAALAAPVGASARLAAEPVGFWGGAYTTRTNEQVSVFSSPTYAVDQAVNQRWADFLASLVHGPELATVRVYRAPAAEVARLCGGNVDVRGCYDRGRIVTLGEDADLTAAAVLAHEYGHHVAANRTNAPWPGLAWGTKRWSSYINVCRHARAKEWWPGAEAPLVYFYNPGEGFAEAYRLLNERRLGLPESPWSIVDPVFRPDARALQLIERDVVDPWRANRTVTLSGKLTASRRVRTFRVATPLDGTLTASVTGGARVDVLTGKRRLAGGSARVETEVCGVRTTALRVTRTVGRGAFRLTISLP
jgi:hypothetical protein